ncbi:MAG TPA: acyl-ACP--UDP-N-acetylglucosamine O-acyltransferase [Firmicutes bacterium]|nr:acyl-ACP--UDP-N-acetylglucosamine O-acyltransferase [Bacillota bacterium]
MKSFETATFRPRKIHSTAVIHPTAKLGRDVEVGPYCVIGAEVVIGDGTRLASHVVIDGPAIIGRNCRIASFACLGGDPQDVKYAGEKTTLVIGDNNLIREYATIHRGTPGGRGETRVGNNNMIMSYAHIAHDCVVGDNVIITGGAAIAGHVTVEDYAVIGGMAGVHQFVRVGRMAMVGGMAKVVKDIPPYFLVDGNPARAIGVNIVGMRRNGVAPEVRAEIRKAFKILYESRLNASQAIARMEQELVECEEIKHLIDFLKMSSRGICSSRPWEGGPAGDARETGDLV